MIVAVDDEELYCELLVEALQPAGFQVRCFASAGDALAALDKLEPELIVSDVEMPEMNGFDFYREYQQKYAFRHTPFVFLTSHREPGEIVRGLDCGVDDYLLKPLHPVVVSAKVRSILSRRGKYISQQFTGDLAEMPFARVLQFCELKKLTGWVDILAEDYSTQISFNGGELQMDKKAVDFEKVFDLPQGHFTINVGELNYLRLNGSESSAVPSGKVAAEKPMGRLSGIKLGQRLFQLQTEFSTLQDRQVVSVVILDGRVVLKRVSNTPDTIGKAELEKIIELQHLSVEEEVQAKLDTLLKKNTDQQSFHQLYDTGFEDYCRGNFPAALKSWEAAEKLQPGDKTLAINLSVVRRKLAARS